MQIWPRALPVGCLRCYLTLLWCPSLVQPQYLGLEQLCQDFAVELLGMCRNQSEVTTILNSCGDTSQDSVETQAFEEGIPNLSRLRLAVNYNQKQVGGRENAVGDESDHSYT